MFELGNNLREARQRRRIDLVVAEQDTKIRSKYLAALETEDFDVLPGPVFIRGFLRTYSRYLGLDPQLFIDEYNARFGRFEEVEEQHANPVLGRPGLAQEYATRGRRMMRLLAVTSLIVVAALAWLGLRDVRTQPAADRPAAPSSEREVVVPAADPDALGDAARAAAAADAPTSMARRTTAPTAPTATTGDAPARTR